MGVFDNETAFRLPVDLFELHHRANTGHDDIIQHVTWAHGGELVLITHQDDLCSGLDRVEQGMGDIDVHHGCLVHDHHIRVDRVTVVFPVAHIPVLTPSKLQEPVQCPGLPTCRLHHPFGRSPGGGRQCD